MWTKYSQGGKVGYQFSEFVVDEEKDLEEIERAHLGDLAYVVKTGSYWVMDSDGEWHLRGAADIPGGGGSCDCDDFVEESTIWEELEN